MRIIQFDRTKLELKGKCLILSKDLTGLADKIELIENYKTDSGWDGKQISEHIYLVNDYLIKKTEQLIGLLNEGLLNEENDYLESDFNIVKTMLNVSVYKLQSLPEFQTNLGYSALDLEFKLSVQAVKLAKLIKKIPDAFANNYKTEIKVIPGIRLDAYQLIYFALSHANHHLKQIDALYNISIALQSEVPQKECREFVYV